MSRKINSSLLLEKLFWFCSFKRTVVHCWVQCTQTLVWWELLFSDGMYQAVEMYLSALWSILQTNNQSWLSKIFFKIRVWCQNNLTGPQWPPFKNEGTTLSPQDWIVKSSTPVWGHGAALSSAQALCTSTLMSVKVHLHVALLQTLLSRTALLCSAVCKKVFTQGTEMSLLHPACT